VLLDLLATLRSNPSRRYHTQCPHQWQHLKIYSSLTPNPPFAPLFKLQGGRCDCNSFMSILRNRLRALKFPNWDKLSEHSFRRAPPPNTPRIQLLSAHLPSAQCTHLLRCSVHFLKYSAHISQVPNAQRSQILTTHTSQVLKARVFSYLVKSTHIMPKPL